MRRRGVLIVLLAVVAGAWGLGAWLTEGPGAAPTDEGSRGREVPLAVEGPTLSGAPAVQEAPVVASDERPATSRARRTHRGQVVDENGDPVVGATVRLADGEPVTTDGEGRYAVEGAEGPPSWLRIEAEGYALVLLDLGQVTAQSMTLERIALSRSWTIEGTVVDATSGGGIPGVVVSSAPALAPDARAWVTTDAEGRFRVGATGPGRRILQLHAGGDHLPRQIEGIEVGARDLRLEMQRGLSIEGRLVDETGRTPEHAVFVTAVARTPAGDPDHTSRRIQTVEDGQVRLRGLRPGRYDISFVPADPDSAIAATVVRDVPAGTRDLLVRVPVGESLRVAILDEQGEPVSGPGSVLAAPAGAPWGAPASRGVWLEQNVHAIPGLERGIRYDLVGKDFPGHGEGRRLGVLSGDRGVEIVLPRGGSLAGRVVGEDGEPVPPGVPVGVFADLVDPATPGTRLFAVTEEGGTFRFEGLAQDYTFTAEAGGGRSGYLGEAAKGVRAGTADLVLRVSEGVEVSGVLVDDAGEPTATTSLQADDGARMAAMRPYAQVGPDGRFVIRGLKKGPVRFTARAGDAWMPVGEAEAPASDIRIVLRLP